MAKRATDKLRLVRSWHSSKEAATFILAIRATPEAAVELDRVFRQLDADPISNSSPVLGSVPGLRRTNFRMYQIVFQFNHAHSPNGQIMVRVFEATSEY